MNLKRKGLVMRTHTEYIESCKKLFHEVLNNSKNRVLIRYTRNKKNQKTGVIVAFRDPKNNQVYIGISKCHLSSGDKFNKYIGIGKAIESSIPAVHSDSLPVPRSMIVQLIIS